MKKVVLDTNILIDAIHGYAPWVKKSLKSGTFSLVVPTIVVAEYFTSHEIETDLGRKRSEEYISWFIKQDLTEKIAKVLATILRRKTYQPGAGLADLIIAATALHLNAELATENKSDFSKIPNLRFFNQRNYL